MDRLDGGSFIINARSKSFFTMFLACLEANTVEAFDEAYKVIKVKDSKEG